MNPVVTNVVNMPFVQVALPILIGFITIGWWQNKRLDEMGRRFDDRIDAAAKRTDEGLASMSKRLDDMNRRLDDMTRRLDRIEGKLDNHADRIARLEERTSPVRA